MTDPVGASAVASATLRCWLCGVAIVYAAMSLTGVTTSSLGIEFLSVTPGEHASGVLVGTPRTIRIDEWNRGTPWLLGLVSRGDDGFASPLAFPDVALVAPTARDVPSALLHWEAVAAKAGAVLPDSLVFAAIWWFPSRSWPRCCRSGSRASALGPGSRSRRRLLFCSRLSTIGGR